MIYSGLCGWQDDLLKQIRGLTVGVPYGGPNFSRKMLDNLHARYVSLLHAGFRLPRFDNNLGNDAATMLQKRLAADTGYPAPLCRAFLVSLYQYAKSGKIPEAKYDPIGAAERRKVRDTLDPGMVSKIKGGLFAGMGGIAVLAAFAVAGYFLLKGAKGAT